MFFDLKTAEIKEKKIIEKTLASGKIKTANEFRLLNEKIDEICQKTQGTLSESEKDLIKKIEGIMDNFAKEQSGSRA